MVKKMDHIHKWMVNGEFNCRFIKGKSHIFKSLLKPGGYYEVPFQVYEGLNEVPLVEQNLHFLIMCRKSIGTPLQLHTA